MNKIVHLFRLGWSYRIMRSTRLKYPPYQFTIEPTNICNLSCRFCPQSDPEHATRRRQDQLTLEAFRGFLDQLAEVRSGNRNLNFTLDGEPFLNRHFIDFVTLATARGFFPVFATNATRLDPATADRLIAAGPFRAAIDFASDREIYETVRGREGDFDRVLANLRYLAGQARSHPGVHIDFHDITSCSGADATRSLAALRALFPADLPPRVRFDVRAFHNFCGHLKQPRSQGSYRLCPYPWTQMAVAHNGDVVGCCRDTVGRAVLGNVFRDDIMTVWNGAPYRQFRQHLIAGRPDLNAACKDCDLPWSGGGKRWKISYMLRSLLGR